MYVLKLAAIFAVVGAFPCHPLNGQSLADRARLSLYGANTSLQTDLLAVRTSSKTGRTFVLLTAKDPNDGSDISDCHACAPRVGIALFQKHNKGWKLIANTEFVTRIGAWGVAPTDIRIIDLGTQEGLLIRGTDMHAGVSEKYGAVLLVEQQAIASVASFDLGNSSYASCDPKEREDPTLPKDGSFDPCFGYKVNLKFGLRKGAPSDILLEKLGTDADWKQDHVLKVHTLTTYRFDGKQYKEISSEMLK